MSVEDSGLESPPERVWYASYGSNLNRDRFMAYIAGGSPPGTDVVYKGARDHTPPSDDISLELPHSLYFAGWSDRAWGGTSGAFVSLRPSQPPALGRAYLITPDQFEDVVKQENAHAVTSGELAIDIEGVRRSGHTRMLPSGFYSELLYLGDRDGFPMLTFTSSQDRSDHNTPSPAYLRMIHSGLAEAHGFGVEESARYFGDKPGLVGKLSLEQLIEILSPEVSE